MKHLLGISGGKDSAALAVYMAQNYPELNIEYYTCDTGKELKETYELIERLESVLGKKIVKYENYNSELSTETNAFDHFLSSYGNMWLLPYGFAYPLIDPPPFYEKMKAKGKFFKLR
jgi:3'-phosphoadenosine 5'-phosphosulfate sulfotransferase (PAPS reductase)/FAD synthetase